MARLQADLLLRGETVACAESLTGGALGELLSAEGADPEIYRWTDGTRSHVICEFRQGKLVKWTLERPPADADTPARGA